MKKKIPLMLLLLASLPVAAETSPEYRRSCGMPIFASGRERSIFSKTTGWKAGQVIKVYFVNGSEKERGEVEHYAREWEKYGNFRFEFHQEPKTQKEHTILIKFEKQDPGVAGWSIVGYGTESTTAHSMSFYPGISGDSTIQHEFGHALGLHHEQENPAGSIDWVPEKAYKYFQETFKWSRQKTDEEIFNKQSDPYKNWTTFDHESTMGYYLPGELFKSGVPLGMRFNLSEGDKQGIAQLYPGRSQPADRAPVFLYHSASGRKLRLYGKSSTARVSIDGQVLHEGALSGQGTNLDLDAYLKGKKNRLQIDFQVTAPDFELTFNFDDGKTFGFGYACKTGYPCVRGAIKPIALHLSHFRDRNRGEESGGGEAVLPPVPLPVDDYADLAGDIPVNAALNNKLIHAIIGRNSSEVRSLLKQGADPNGNYQGWTPLIYAAYMGENEAVKMLIVRKAQLDVKLADYWTPYMIAKKLNRLDTAELLAKAGASTRAAGISSRSLPGF